MYSTLVDAHLIFLLQKRISEAPVGWLWNELPVRDPSLLTARALRASLLGNKAGAACDKAGSSSTSRGLARML